MRIVAAVLLLPWAATAQMSLDQRLFDFQYLASVYAKFYGPYEWKRDVLRFDLYEIGPWLERVRRANNDLEYYEIAAEYVAHLADSHSAYSLPSNFVARLPLTADLYDGKILIDSVDRRALPRDRYPIQIGDEVVSLDERAPDDWMAEFSRLVTMANPRGTRRLAASYLFYRPQAELPRAHEIGEVARLVLRRDSGEPETYEIAWIKTGVPLERVGPVPKPAAAGRAAQSRQTLLARMRERRVPARGRILGRDSRAPVFRLPEGFTQRLGRTAADFHYSGVYEAGGKRIGFLRIPHFSPFSASGAERELRNEVAWLEQNTDGLVVDVTRNLGGGCYGETALSLLIPYRFRSIADEVRPNRGFILDLESELAAARAVGAEEWEIATYEFILAQVRQAYRENRGRTGPIPTCQSSADLEPAKDASGRIVAYSKPLIVLTDEFTVSWGDAFAAVMQDARRGPLVGMRTDGAGGMVLDGPAGFYSEASASYTISLGTRAAPVVTPDFPTTAYIENVGVRPDVEIDLMTRENLLSGGRAFVEGFTAAILEEIARKGRP